MRYVLAALAVILMVASLTFLGLTLDVAGTPLCTAESPCPSVTPYPEGWQP
jgi:ABC-type dipeptide/oligopeptide/nickel transport system permease subunit